MRLRLAPLSALANGARAFVCKPDDAMYRESKDRIGIC